MVSPNLEVLVQDQSLQSFLGLTRDKLAEGLKPDVLLAAADADSRKFGAWLKTANVGSVRAQIADHVCDALKGSIVDVFAGAWAKYSELKKCANETRDDPKSTASVTLAEHEFSYDLEFNVDVLVNNVRLVAVRFQLSLACTVDGITLLLKNGCVEEISGGTAACKAAIRCGSSQVWSRQIAESQLPGNMHLDNPIALYR